ncbi:AAA family ATPase [Bacillus sp. S/N-304-OC-R1]|uniref:AAA family ATPase n=1 Tax=Bacillus sp. S/N-304-OC-R1 TaxID=2758034 RepID=UPI0028BDFB17|nr:AAA family ATPase [Bacillus sp. S/N-304-OC-R1]
MDGLGGAGKTTLTQHIKQELEEAGKKAVVLHIDDFIHPRNIRYDQAKCEWECYYFAQWRYDYLIHNILLPIQNGEEIDKEIELYDKTNDQYIETHLKIDAESVLIIEGVFLQRNELRRFLDYVIYIDVPKVERLKRVLERDTYIGDKSKIAEKYEKRYFPAEDKYIMEYSPSKSADLIINPNS